MKHKQIEVFSGTGGVGKTTLATARAVELARKNYKVLLITIDPSKRLKQLMHLQESQVGENILINDPFAKNENLPLWVQLMGPTQTMQRLFIKNLAKEKIENRILTILSRPYGGLNEILALVELHLNLQNKEFDIVVLDTPPGSHFLDFLESADKIKLFFDKRFIDVYHALTKGNKNAIPTFGRKLMATVLSTGAKKLLDSLKFVTGQSFVEEFLEAVGAIYQTKSDFLAALNIQNVLTDSDQTNWFLVTSADQDKIEQAIEIINYAKDILERETTVLVNKSLLHSLKNWSPPEEDQMAQELKTRLEEKENNIIKLLSPHFNQIYNFDEILSNNPLEHVEKLGLQWQKYFE